MSETIKLSAHAIERYMERSGTKKRTRAENRLKKMLDGAERVEVNGLRKTLAIITHGFQDATYLKSGGWLLVVCDDTLVTVYPATGSGIKH